MLYQRIKKYKIDRISAKYLPLLIILQTYAPIISASDLGKFPQAYSYAIYGVLALFSSLYIWIHRDKLIKDYPVIAGLCAFMAVYVIAAFINLYYHPSPIFPFQRLALFCNFLSIGTIFMLQQQGVVGRTFRMWWRYVPWIVIATYPIVHAGLTIRSLFLTFLFVMLASCMRRQLRGLSYLFIAFITLFCIRQRMDYLFVLAPAAVYLMLRFNKFLSYQASILLYHIMMCLPVLFLVLALTGVFNVLKFDSYVEGEYTTNIGESFTADTRTSIYQEAIDSSLKNKYVLFGRTPGYGYDSKFVETRENAYIRIAGVAPQRNSEVFIVNIFTWCGVLGMIAWFIFYYWFGISTLRRAQNRYVRGLVLYVGMFWICAWISNHFLAPDNTYMMLYIIISICIQPQFRNMNDDQIKQYFRHMLK